jgi:hypothetical protein
MDTADEPDSEPTLAADLTPEQLQDLVVAASPANDAEAMFLSNLLEDAGIPAATEGDRLGALTGGFGGQHLYVPRVLSDKAKALIVEARTGVKKGRVEDAFEPESVVESLEDKKADPILLEMARLRDEPEIQRNEILAKHIIQWQSENRQSVERARFLAAAGLSREQADELLSAVVKHSGDEIASVGSSKVWWGVACIVSGCLWFVAKLALYAPQGYEVNYARPMILITSGFILIVIGSSIKPRASLIEENEVDTKK